MCEFFLAKRKLLLVCFDRVDSIQLKFIEAIIHISIESADSCQNKAETRKFLLIDKLIFDFHRIETL